MVVRPKRRGDKCLMGANGVKTEEISYKVTAEKK